MICLLPASAQGNHEQTGHYDVTYSDGSWAYSGDYGSDSGSYFLFYNAFYVAFPFGTGQNCFASCSGTITATFNWVPAYAGEHPPASVIVQEDSLAYAAVYETSGNPLVPVVDDGFGDADTLYLDSNSAYVSGSGTRYSVKTDPGSSFAIHCSPSIFCMASNGSATGDVFYSATTYPVVVNLDGVVQTIDGAMHILIGQECAAAITVVGKHFDLTNPSWNISGDIFTNWDAHGPDISKAVFYPVDYTNPQLALSFG